MIAARGEQAVPIAVVGMSGRFASCPDLDAFADLVRTGATAIERFPVDEDGSRFSAVGAAGLMPGSDLFDAGVFGITDREARLLDPQHRIALEEAVAALEDAGHVPGDLGSVSVYATCNTSGYRERALAAARSPAEAFLAHVSTVHDCLASRVSYHLDLSGEALTVQTACSSSLVAVHLACQSLRAGTSDASLVVGVSVDDAQIRAQRYQEGMIYARDGICRPFDEAAEGIVEGQGGGAVLLRRLPDALAAQDAIHGVVLGTAVNNDGRQKLGMTAPGLTGQVRVLEAALEAAGVDPSTVAYVEAHGTGTPLGDPLEVEALSRVYGNGDAGGPPCYLGSVKANVGHLIQAAGLAGLVKTVLCMKDRAIPPIANLRTPNRRIPWDTTRFRLPVTAEPWPGADHPVRAAVSSFGIGGTNAHAVLEGPPDPGGSPQGATTGREGVVPVVLSADSEAALDQQRSRLAEMLTRRAGLTPQEIAFTLAAGRTARRVRWGAEVSSREELLAGLSGAAGSRAVGSALAEWLQGGDVDWGGMPWPSRRRVHLPTYAFQRSPYGLPAAPAPPTREAPGGEHAASAGPAATRGGASSIEEMVLEVCCEHMDERDLTRDDDLYGAGLDSLTLIDVISDCESRTDMDVSLDDALACRTARQIAQLFAAGAPAPPATDEAGDPAAARAPVPDPQRRYRYKIKVGEEVAIVEADGSELKDLPAYAFDLEPVPGSDGVPVGQGDE